MQNQKRTFSKYGKISSENKYSTWLVCVCLHLSETLRRLWDTWFIEVDSAISKTSIYSLYLWFIFALLRSWTRWSGQPYFNSLSYHHYCQLKNFYEKYINLYVLIKTWRLQPYKWRCIYDDQQPIIQFSTATDSKGKNFTTINKIRCKIWTNVSNFPYLI